MYDINYLLYGFIYRTNRKSWIMELNNLESFPRVQPLPTICEIDSKFIAAHSSLENPTDPNEYIAGLPHYPNIVKEQLKTIFAPKIPPIRTIIKDKCLLLSPEIGITLGLWNAWWDNGFSGVRDYLADSASIPKLVQLSAQKISSIFSAIERKRIAFNTYFSPHMMLKREELIENFSPVRDWNTCWVKALAWHPNCSKFAIAIDDDSIRYYTLGVRGVLYLKTSEQVNVCYLAWKPYSSSQLAVAVDSGVLIWNLTSGNNFGPNKSSLLKPHKNHSPVTCLAYSPNGEFLLSTSARDSSIYIYNTVTWQYYGLVRFGGFSIPLAKWSPNGKQIISSYTDSVFRIWKVDNKWKNRVWNTVNGPLESACWSPCSTMLLFASQEILYLVNFKSMEFEFDISATLANATPIFDLRLAYIVDPDSGQASTTGGKVREILWDNSGNRVAIHFDKSDFIAIFRVQSSSKRNFLAPLGLIRGHEGEFPLGIAFQNDFQLGALLTIAWSGGRIQYFPMMFAHFQSNAPKNLVHQDVWTTTKVFKPQDESILREGEGDTINSRNSSSFMKSKEDVSIPTKSFKLYSI